MRKRFLVYLFILSASFAACARRGVPVYADAGALVDALYAEAGFDTEALYGEELVGTDAFRFGITVSDFENTVEDAVSFRKNVDEDGQQLYALKLHTEKDAALLAQKFYAHYDFAPCDPAEKMAIASFGQYVIFFKSNGAEVDAAVEAFHRLMGGMPDFEKEMFNRT